MRLFIKVFAYSLNLVSFSWPRWCLLPPMLLTTPGIHWCRIFYLPQRACRLFKNVPKICNLPPGLELFIFLSWNEKEICPVKFIKPMIRAQKLIHSDPLFMHKSGQDKIPLTTFKVRATFSKALVRMGLEPKDNGFH